MADERGDRKDQDAHARDQDQGSVEPSEVEAVGGFQQRGGKPETGARPANHEFGDDGPDQGEPAGNLQSTEEERKRRGRGESCASIAVDFEGLKAREVSALTRGVTR